MFDVADICPIHTTNVVLKYYEIQPVSFDAIIVVYSEQGRNYSKIFKLRGEGFQALTWWN